MDAWNVEVPLNPYILIVSGHRSYGDRGNPVERELTDDLARAYKQAFRAAGFVADWFQEIDGDASPTMTNGGLDGIALGCGRILAARAEPLTILLDLHFDGSDSPIHVIPAHNVNSKYGGMLNTAYPQGRIPSDTMDNNPLDVELAVALAIEISQATGIEIYRPNDAFPGVMPENITGVGGDGYRLAMMAATASSRLKAIRVTIEHGGTRDADRRDFFNLCAKAAVKAVISVLPEVTKPTIPPKEPTTSGPLIPYPDGLNRSLASRLFSFVIGDDDVKYAFNESGPISNLWLSYGIETGRWPRLEDVVIGADKTKVFIFSDGSVVVDTITAPPVYL